MRKTGTVGNTLYGLFRKHLGNSHQKAPGVSPSTLPVLGGTCLEREAHTTQKNHRQGSSGRRVVIEKNRTEREAVNFSSAEDGVLSGRTVHRTESSAAIRKSQAGPVHQQNATPPAGGVRYNREARTSHKTCSSIASNRTTHCVRFIFCVRPCACPCEERGWCRRLHAQPRGAGRRDSACFVS